MKFLNNFDKITQENDVVEDLSREYSIFHGEKEIISLLKVSNGSSVAEVQSFTNSRGLDDTPGGNSVYSCKKKLHFKKIKEEKLWLKVILWLFCCVHARILCICLH